MATNRGKSNKNTNGKKYAAAQKEKLTTRSDKFLVHKDYQLQMLIPLIPMHITKLASEPSFLASENGRYDP